MKKNIPNILTYARLGLCLVMFVAFALLSWGINHMNWPLSLPVLEALIFWPFVIAAVTDFFDGWLARRWGVESMTGVILDPIADKILVCGAILGLMTIVPDLLVPAGIILFREFAVSALREVLAPRGIKLPVTFLAKTKTALQLVTIGGLMACAFVPELRQYFVVAWLAFVVAALVTLWTGIEYGLAAKKALRGAV